MIESPPDTPVALKNHAACKPLCDAYVIVVDQAGRLTFLYGCLFYDSPRTLPFRFTFNLP
jgi:hypothetical protein